MAEVDFCNSAKAKLCKFSCPFTWKLLEVASLYFGEEHRREDYGGFDNKILCAILVNSLVKCYEGIISADTDYSRKHLQEGNKILEHIQKEQSLWDIEKALVHIYWATACFFLYEIEDNENLKIALKNVPDISGFNNKELGALDGCEGIAFSMYYEYGIKDSIIAAERAIEKDQGNALWCYLLATNLRRQRKCLSIHTRPTDLERKYFDKAYSLSEEPVFKIFYAEMLSEDMFRWRNSSEGRFIAKLYKEELFHLYKEIFNTATKNVTVLLRLALAFSRYGKEGAPLGHKCLDYVNELCPNNFPADMLYIKYLWEESKNDTVEYLFKMLSRYPFKYYQHYIYLYIAIAYSINHENMKTTAEYYLKAISILPDSKLLTRYRGSLTREYTGGIYDFLLKSFLPELKRISKEDVSVIDIYNQLKAVCNAHMTKDEKIVPK